LVLAVGSHVAVFCAESGAAATAPMAKAVATMFTEALIKDLPDSLIRVDKLRIIYRPAFFVPVAVPAAATRPPGPPF
jgi:hypothetical protein